MLRCRAFTLIEMAIVLAIVGLMVGFGIQAYESSTGLACYEKTEQQMRVINEALQRFVTTNNRLPKPAYMSHGTNNPLFGREPASATAVDAAGYATEVPAGMVATGGVLFGQLPHVTLGLSQDYSADCWGSKFTYAVTNAMTSANTTNGYPLTTTEGVIRLYSNTAAAGVLQSDKIAHVVISHGVNKFGATPISYNDITARDCNGTGSTIIDKENCDTAAGGNINFWNSVRNTGSDAGANYFDDIVIYSGKTILSTEDDCPFCWLPALIS